MSPILRWRWLPYNFVRGYVGGFPSPVQAQIVVNGRDIYTGLPAIPSIPLLWDLPTWSQAREEATRRFHHVHKTPLSDSFPNTPMLLKPPSTTKEAQLDSSVQTNEAQPSSTIAAPPSASPRTETPQMALQPLSLLDSK